MVLVSVWSWNGVRRGVFMEQQIFLAQHSSCFYCMVCLVSLWNSVSSRHKVSFLRSWHNIASFHGMVFLHGAAASIFMVKHGIALFLPSQVIGMFVN